MKTLLRCGLADMSTIKPHCLKVLALQDIFQDEICVGFSLIFVCSSDKKDGILSWIYLCFCFPKVLNASCYVSIYWTDFFFSYS